MSFDQSANPIKQASSNLAKIRFRKRESLMLMPTKLIIPSHSVKSHYNFNRKDNGDQSGKSVRTVKSHDQESKSLSFTDEGQLRNLNQI